MRPVRQAPTVSLSSADRTELETLAAGGKGSPRHALRAQIVLLAAQGRTNGQIAQALHVHPETVTRWRQRFSVNRLDALGRDAPRSGSRTRIPADLVERILRMTTTEVSPAGKPWTTRSLARALQVNHMLVYRIWKANGVAPSARREPGVAEARPSAGVWADVLGAYVGWPAAAIVFGVGPRSEPPDEPMEHPRTEPESMVGYVLSDQHSTPAGLANLLAGVEENIPRASGTRNSPHELLVFLRGLEEITGQSTALHVIFDRPVDSASSRLVSWLRAHPRFHVLSVSPGSPWHLAVDTWIRTFRDLPLHAHSFRGIPALAEALRRSEGTSSAGRRFAWTLAPALEVGPSMSPTSVLHSLAPAVDLPVRPRAPLAEDVEKVPEPTAR